MPAVGLDVRWRERPRGLDQFVQHHLDGDELGPIGGDVGIALDERSMIRRIATPGRLGVGGTDLLERMLAIGGRLAGFDSHCQRVKELNSRPAAGPSYCVMQAGGRHDAPIRPRGDLDHRVIPDVLHCSIEQAPCIDNLN